MLSCEFCKTFKSIIFTEDLWRLLLYLSNILVISKTIILVTPFKTSKIRRWKSEKQTPKIRRLQDVLNRTYSRGSKPDVCKAPEIWCPQDVVDWRLQDDMNPTSSRQYLSEIFCHDVWFGRKTSWTFSDFLKKS